MDDTAVPESRPVLPVGGLRIRVDCRTSASEQAGPHDATITPRWTLEGPHDLDAERVGVALGGVCSCVDLADRTLPAVRGYVTHRLRAAPAEIVHSEDGSWRPARDVAGCCRDQPFPQARDAAAHVRRPRHWAERFGADPRAVAGLAAAVLESVPEWARGRVPADQSGDPPCPDVPSADQGLVEASAWRSLWDAGLHPVVVAALCRGAGASGLPAPAVLEAAYGRPEGGRPAERPTGRPRRSGRRHQPGERAEWAAAGVRPATITALLSEDAYSLGDARILAARLSRSVGEAADVLARWQRIGLTPPVDALVGVYWGPMLCDVPPPAAQVDRVVARSRAHGVPVTRLTAAQALIRSGSPDAAVAYLADPLRRPDDPYSP